MRRVRFVIRYEVRRWDALVHVDDPEALVEAVRSHLAAARVD